MIPREKKGIPEAKRISVAGTPWADISASISATISSTQSHNLMIILIALLTESATGLVVGLDGRSNADRASPNICLGTPTFPYIRYKCSAASKAALLPNNKSHVCLGLFDGAEKHITHADDYVVHFRYMSDKSSPTASTRSWVCQARG